MIARVYLTPASGVGGEFRTAVPFDLNTYSRAFVSAYAAACRARGQKARIVWPRKRNRS